VYGLRNDKTLLDGNLCFDDILFGLGEDNNAGNRLQADDLMIVSQNVCCVLRQDQAGVFASKQ